MPLFVRNRNFGRTLVFIVFRYRDCDDGPAEGERGAPLAGGYPAARARRRDVRELVVAEGEGDRREGAHVRLETGHRRVDGEYLQVSHADGGGIRAGWGEGSAVAAGADAGWDRGPLSVQQPCLESGATIECECAIKNCHC